MQVAGDKEIEEIIMEVLEVLVVVPKFLFLIIHSGLILIIGMILS